MPRYRYKPDDDPDSSQDWRRKTHKPKGKQRLHSLQARKNEQADDELIQRLVELGHLSEVLSELKSGKEATAYVAHKDGQRLLLKIYRDLAVRSFKNDQIYQEGKAVVDERARRAVAGRTRKGREMVQSDWVMAEYRSLWKLWQAGLSVPRPSVGPNLTECAETIPAVLMELVGNEEDVAPRLSDVKLTEEEAQSAWQQAVQGMSELLRLEYVHGDYSAYNLLWWENTVIMIDVPQLSTSQSPVFKTLLERDAASLSSSFRRHGIRISPEETLREVHRGLEHPAPTPRLVLP